MSIILNSSVVRDLPWMTMPDASRRDAISITPGVSRGARRPIKPLIAQTGRYLQRGIMEKNVRRSVYLVLPIDAALLAEYGECMEERTLREIKFIS
jgi:hypothetical protein